jgi:glycosyltransferase involved in cell wall biosynthesis
MLAEAIGWVLQDPQRHRQLGAAARERAGRLWHLARIAGLYAEVYRQALKSAESVQIS